MSTGCRARNRDGVTDRRRRLTDRAEHQARRVQQVHPAGRGRLSGDVAGQGGKVQRRVHDTRHAVPVGSGRAREHDRRPSGDPPDLIRAKRHLSAAQRLDEVVPVAQADAVAFPGRLADQTTVGPDQADVEHPRLQSAQPAQVARASLAVLAGDRRCLRYGQEKLPDTVQAGLVLIRHRRRSRIELIARALELQALFVVVADQLHHRQRDRRQQDHQHQQLAQAQPGAAAVQIVRIERIGRLERGVGHGVSRAPCKAREAPADSAALRASSTSDSRFQQCQYS